MADEQKETLTADQADDKVLDDLEATEKETPPDSSDGKETEGKETESKEDAGADQQEKASPDGEGEKSKDPRDLMFRKGYNEAKAKGDKEIEELKKNQLSKEEIADIKKITSSPSFIRESMRAEGYKDEVIDSRLKELGHEVPVKTTDDLALITSKLNLNPDTMDENQKATLSDIAKVVDVLFQDRIGKVLPDAIKPLQEQTEQILQSNNSQKLVQEMNKVVESEGKLDFKEDIEPKLNEWIDAQKTPPSQQDVFNYFKDLNHTLILERDKTGEKKQVRDKKKENLRGNKEGALSGRVVVGDKKFSDDDVLDQFPEVK